MSLILANARWAGDYLLSVPECVANDLDGVRRDFYAWLDDEDDSHGYREKIIEGRPRKVYFMDGRDDLCGAEVFVAWLNGVALRDSGERAAILPRVELYESEE